MIKQNKGITLVALVVTIIILLILAGITILSISGENGLISKVNQAKKSQIKAEIKETLILAINELQLEKEGKATLDDIKQEWADNELKNYNLQITSDASLSGKKITIQKNAVTEEYIIDENLNITEVEENSSSIKFSYDTFERIDNKVKILIRVQDKESGLSRIEFPDRDSLTIEENKKEEKEINYKVELGVEYKIKITSENGQTKEETILITDYWYEIIKDLGEGIEIDNPAIKVAYNKSYQAKITIKDGYIIDNISVKMGGQEVTTDENNIVDIETGRIYIEKVTGDIEIKEIKRLYLYKEGDMCEEITGGYEKYSMVFPSCNSGSGSAIIGMDGGMKISHSSGGNYAYGTKNSIDTSKFSKIYIDGILTISSNNFNVSFSYNKEGSRSNWDFTAQGFGVHNIHAVPVINNYPVNVRKNLCFDLKQYTGNVYLMFDCYSDVFTVYNIYLE